MEDRLSQKYLEAAEIPIEDEYKEPFRQDSLPFRINTKKKPTKLIALLAIFILIFISILIILYFFFFLKIECEPGYILEKRNCVINHSLKAVYNITNKDQIIKLFNISISTIKEIIIDGKKIDICNEYRFPSIGLHSVLALFDLSQTKSLEKMFYKIEDLVSISFTNKFNIESIDNMESMFKLCTKLTSIDLSNINAQNVISMNYIFESCSSLETINLNNFNVQNTQKMYGLFKGCYSLKSIDLSSFNAINIDNMRNLFDNCSSITSIDLSNFVTDKVTDMRHMFRIAKN